MTARASGPDNESVSWSSPLETRGPRQRLPSTAPAVRIDQRDALAGYHGHDYRELVQGVNQQHERHYRRQDCGAGDVDDVLCDPQCTVALQREQDEEREADIGERPGDEAVETVDQGATVRDGDERAGKSRNQ